MAPPSEPTASTKGRQIPIVCPGHTRPLAELQFCSVNDNPNGDDEPRTFLVSACHDKCPMVRDAESGDWIGTFKGHKGAVWSCRLDPAAFLGATASGELGLLLLVMLLDDVCQFCLLCIQCTFHKRLHFILYHVTIHSNRIVQHPSQPPLNNKTKATSASKYGTQSPALPSTPSPTNTLSNPAIGVQTPNGSPPGETRGY